ncbi:MAG: glycosyltransferase family 4 protein [Thermoplasmatales archaeon]|nr:MAG: glycosyltransferase family 4 protein [Thermoplasmatales archaeon]
MKIGFVGTCFWPIIGGMETYLYRLSREFVIQGHAVTVATRFVNKRPREMMEKFTKIEQSKKYNQEGVKVHVISAGSVGKQLLKPVYRLHFYKITEIFAITLFSLAFYKSIEVILEDCDILHYSGTGRELLGYCALKLAKKKKIPFVITPHTHIGSWGEGDIDLRLYRQADIVIVLTKVERDYFIKNDIPESKLRIIENGVNVTGNGKSDEFQSKYKIKNTIILFVGRKDGSKGYPLLLEAAKLVWRKIPNVNFVFIGPREDVHSFDKEFQEILKDSRVHELGIISEKEKEDAYAACDIFCLPSAAEAFGMVYLEAWKYKKPVIALNIPTLNELIGTINGGLLVKKDPGDVARAIITLLEDKDLRENLGRNGFKRLKGNSWGNIAKKIEFIYKNISKQSRE